jgi:hypothetical protein
LLLAKFLLETEFVFSLYFSVLITGALCFGTVLLGLSNIRPVLKKSPLEILRSEV